MVGRCLLLPRLFCFLTKVSSAAAKPVFLLKFLVFVTSPTFLFFFLSFCLCRISFFLSFFHPSSPPSLSSSAFSGLSFCLLKVLNKQTSSGWLGPPIYNSSQSNYSRDVCQTHEVHLCASESRRERKNYHHGLDRIYRKAPSIEVKD